MADDLERSLAVIRRFVATYHPAADTALLAGSRARGEGVAHSDYDIVLLYRALPDGAWRETVRFEGGIIEVFSHDLATLAYFCREVDRPSGKPVLPNLVAEGVPISSDPSALLDAARRIAGETLRLGPTPLDAEALRLARYTLTDLAAALPDRRGGGVRLAVGATLYIALADFALRAAGHWSASGKAVPRALAALDPALARRFETAFGHFFSTGETEAVRALVHAVLAPHGGPLRDGFRRTAPATWRLP
ncbi:nucleotidyltransferase domain-containing protein [Methylobacterium terricola]|uniref:Nucleotidyltransferase domain-containing protein n=1 Tax=Methylobacterium terricola TaxID=2583531 RepID=A0A5C4LAA2_9HYPH|nr:nucleotidyltransferase domain-containing protein [Methylobacterium terricola]TNC09564.1 nucleotidyltransferase domain-containing protein [Methylobacterium terricola]